MRTKVMYRKSNREIVAERRLATRLATLHRQAENQARRDTRRAEQEMAKLLRMLK